MVIYNNKVFVLPYTFSDGRLTSLLNSIRQEAIQSVLTKLQQDSGNESEILSPSMVLNAPFVNVYDYDFEDRKVLIVVNASGDDLDEVRIKLSSHIPNPESIYEISRSSADMVKLDNHISDGEFVFKGLKNLELKAFILNMVNIGFPVMNHM